MSDNIDDMEIGDLVKITGEDWDNYDPPEYNRIVLVVGVHEFTKEPTFIALASGGWRDFSATLIQKAIK